MQIVNVSINNRSVVIADDDDVTRDLLAALLHSSGLQILGQAQDGIRALDMVQKLKPEIVCLDIDMPGLTGLEVLAKIREQNSDAIVLMITGATSGENVRNAIAGRADGIIAKPFNTVKVIGELERALVRTQNKKTDR
jgi:two-component system, chemotaxis family, chemotaxis protein CheY